MIFISDETVDAIYREGEKCYPDECCGIIFGKLVEGQIKYAERLEPIANSFDENEKYHRFLITPETMMQAELTARKNKLDIVGFYHSHPNQEAVPSQYDKEHALPVYSYMIVSVVQGKAEDIKSWELITDRLDSPFFKEEVIAGVGKVEKGARYINGNSIDTHDA